MNQPKCDKSEELGFGPVRLGIITTHPVHYFVPLIREIARISVTVQVAYLHDAESEAKGMFDLGFNRAIVWDSPLLEGYDWKSLGISRSTRMHRRISEFFRIRKEVTSWCDTFSPDVVLVPGWSVSYVFVARTLRSLRIPMIIRPEARSPKSRSWLSMLMRDLARKYVVRNSAAAAVIGSVAYDELRRLGFSADSLFFSPYSVELEPQANYAEGAVELSRANLGLASDELVFLYVGKVADYKRVDRLIESFALLHELVPNSHLLIVGDGPLRHEMQTYASSLGLENDITWNGFQLQGNLQNFYLAADAFCLFSDETWGLVVNEAMAFGMPVLVSHDAGSSRDLVAHGLNGFRLDISKPHECAAYMAQMSDPSLRQKMSQNGKELVSRFSIRVAAVGISRAAMHVHHSKLESEFGCDES